MKLEKLKQNKQQSANYMFDFIAHVTSSFGKRDWGSKGEKDAINYMAQEVAPYADSVTTQKYDVHTLAFMGWIYITVTLILGAFVAAFFMPMLSLIFIAVGMEIMILEFVLYRKVVDKLFPKRESLNMMALKKPTGEVKRRVLISGHADAAYEWTLNYYLGGKAFIAHFLISIIGILYFTGVAMRDKQYVHARYRHESAHRSRRKRRFRSFLDFDVRPFQSSRYRGRRNGQPHGLRYGHKFSQSTQRQRRRV